MKTQGTRRRVALLLVISLAATLTITSPAGALSVRDPNYNGIWQDWGGGWQYIYWSASDYAAWALNGKTRLAYEYTNQQWWDCDKFSSWRTIGATGVGDWWIGDGGWHNLKNGWSYSFISSADFSTWAVNGVLARFLYEYGKGQWWDYGTAWNKIGAVNVSASFVGDGAWHSLNNGWTYSYNSSADLSAWADNGLARFLYEYGKGQWWDYGTNWYAMGLTNVSSAFIGDGTWHNLNNGWSYAYDSSVAFGAWAVNGVLARFLYEYGKGQWWDYGTNWYAMGLTNVSSAFIGDGTWHSLNNGWSYQYDTPGDLGTWRDDGQLRFRYQYLSGQWWDKGSYGDWDTLGAAGLSAAFLGDGAVHTLDTNWTYQFAGGLGYWTQVSSGLGLFNYNYATGQWQDQGSDLTWQLLGPTGLSATFLGDGDSHALDSTWSYQFTGGVGYWTNANVALGAFALFSYDYGTGQWKDQGAAGGWQVLSPTGFSALFMGDGNPHTLNSTWSYTFSGTTGTWRSASLGRDLFNYNYSAGQWKNQGSDLTWQNLGPTGLSAAFLGDGSSHTLDSTWSYIFSGTTGTWTNATLGRSLFAYDYVNGLWQDRGWDLGWQILGYANMSGPTNYSAAFIGDGNAHTLDADWSYRFTGTVGTWINATLGRDLFGYDYADGQWLHYDATTSGDLGSNHKSRSYFIGDGYWHNVGSAGEGSWSFLFIDSSMAGLFGWTALGTRFTYDYTNGHWLTKGYASSTLQLGTLKLDTWVGDGYSHNMGSGWQFKFGYGADRATFSNSSYATQFAYDYATGQWNHLYAGTFYTLGNSGQAISNTLYDSNKHYLSISSQYAYYQFVTGTIDGSPREAAYYYGAGGDYVGLVYSYRVSGANEGRWGMYQGGNGAQLLWFTGAGLNPGVNFADGQWHTIYSGTEYQVQVKWLPSDLADEWWGWHDATTVAMGQVGSHGALHFKGTQTAEGDSETYRYAAGDDVWNDQWNENSKWYLIASYNPSAGLHKYYATSLAAYFDYGSGLSGRYFAFNDTHGNDFSFMIGNGLYLSANYNMNGQNYTYIYDPTSTWGLPGGSYYPGLNPGYYR